MKTFDEGHFAYYNDEKQAFDALKSNKGMIRYLGSYGHKEKRTVTANTNQGEPVVQKTIMTKHILLEYGRYSLMGIFEHRLPPVFSGEIENFWRSLIEIADALQGIHKLETEGGAWSG